MKFTDWHKLLFVAVVEEDRKGNRNFQLADVADQLGVPYPSGWVRKAAELYEGRGLFEVLKTLGEGEDGGLYVTLTAEGLEAFETEEWPEPIDRSDTTPVNRGVAVTSPVGLPPAPPQDRFLRRSDNESAFAAAVVALDGLTDAVRSSNSLFAAAEERLAIVREVEGLRRLLDHGVVRARALWDAIRPRGILGWLAVVATGVTANFATDAIRAISSLLQ